MHLKEMSKPIGNLKKLRNRSWKEIKTRGAQAVYVYADQIGLTGKLPTDAEFFDLLDAAAFGGRKISAEAVLEKFFENAAGSFFQSFAEKEKTLETFRRYFGARSARYFIETADRACVGKFDLLGFSGLDFGAKIDWHFEPVAKKRSPVKHWKQFDELETRETGDKKIIWELNRHQHFFALGVAYWLTSDERYAEAFARQMESWMAQNPPGEGINWFSSLEIAFRSISWIWAFNFFKDSPHLSPALFQKALKFLYLQARHIEKYLSTFYSPNTHLTGEALGLYYLGTQLPFFARAREWKNAGEEILFAELDRQILADGVYFEQTTWYQRYTADFYTHFLILKALQKDKPFGWREKKLKKDLQSQLDFLMYITRPDGTTPLIGDDDGGRLLPLGNARSDDFRSTLAAGAVLFERGDYKFVAENAAEELVWLFGPDGPPAFDALEARRPEKTSAAFADGGYFVMRDGWDVTDNFLLIDAGPHGALSGGHAHADALAIDLAAGGRSLLVDAGTYTYHESIEMRNYFRSTAAHNTLTVDGQSSSEPGGKFDWLTRAGASLEKWITEERFDFLSASHDGYERFLDAPVRHRRSIFFLKNDYWIMRDFAETAGPHDYALNFHFAPDVAPRLYRSEKGKTFVGAKSGNQTGLRIFTLDSGNWKTEDSWISNKYGEKRTATLASFETRSAGPQEFFTFLLPVDPGFPEPEVVETPAAGGRAFVIKFRDYTDLLVFADAGQIIRTEFFNTNFRFTWARIAPGENEPEEFVLINGSMFALPLREVVNHPKTIEFAVARRFGRKLNVRTNQTVFSVSVPQKRSSTFILKNNFDDEPEEVK